MSGGNSYSNEEVPSWSPRNLETHYLVRLGFLGCLYISKSEHNMIVKLPWTRALKRLSDCTRCMRSLLMWVLTIGAISQHLRFWVEPWGAFCHISIHEHWWKKMQSPTPVREWSPGIKDVAFKSRGPLSACLCKKEIKMEKRLEAVLIVQLGC